MPTLDGVKVFVHESVAHRSARLREWRKRLPLLGGELMETPSESVTHLLTSADVHPSISGQRMPQAQVVSEAWLEACLAVQQRVLEFDYLIIDQTALAQSGHPTEHEQVQPAIKLQLHHPIQLNNVQQALLSLAAAEPCPKWLAIQCKEAIKTVVVLMLPGIDQQLFAKYENLLPEMRQCLGLPVPLTAKSSGVHPLQTSRSMLTVDSSALRISKKRKRDAQDYTSSQQAEGNTLSKLADGSKACKMVEIVKGSKQLVHNQDSQQAQHLQDFRQVDSRKDSQPAEDAKHSTSAEGSRDSKQAEGNTSSRQAADLQGSMQTVDGTDSMLVDIATRAESTAYISNNKADTEDSKPPEISTDSTPVEGAKDSNFGVNVQADNLDSHETLPVSGGIDIKPAEDVTYSTQAAGNSDSKQALGGKDVQHADGSKDANQAELVEVSMPVDGLTDSKPGNNLMHSMQAEDGKYSMQVNDTIGSKKAEDMQDSQHADVSKAGKKSRNVKDSQPNEHARHSQQVEPATDTMPASAAPNSDKRQSQAMSAGQLPLEHYQASLMQMQASGYPLPIQSYSHQEILPVGFVASHQTGESSDLVQRVVAVDCEMCYTRKALELTRVTLVGEDEQVLLDELVLPADPIVNYNTEYSGISPAMMRRVKTTLHQIQQRVLQFVGADTLLVGHSLENDLRVLNLVHLKNLDTAILYPHPRWPTQQNSLRVLASTYLDWIIQRGSHDSKIDAIAALRLVKLKLQHGPFFGTSGNAHAQNLMDVLHDHGRACCMLDRPDVLAWHATQSCQTKACLTDEQTVDAACQCLQQGTADFVWLQLWALADLYEDRGHHKLGRQQKWPYPSGQEVEQAGEPSEADCLKCLDAHVKQLHDALMPDSVLLVITGQGDSTQQRHKEEHAKEVRYARQLALATNTRYSVQSKYGKDDKSASNALCFCTVR